MTQDAKKRDRLQAKYDPFMWSKIAMGWYGPASIPVNWDSVSKPGQTDPKIDPKK